jgi:hypothetical protein
MPNGRCRMHGGLTPVGIESPHIRHGRYSADIPTRLAAKYQEARNDEELLVLRDEIALLDARLAEVLGRLDTGESGALWKALAAIVGPLSRDFDQLKREEVKAGLASASSLIARGIGDYAVWADLRALLDERRKLVESERKRLVDMQQMITSERAMLLIAAITDTVLRHVADTGTRAAIAADIRKLTAG